MRTRLSILQTEFPFSTKACPRARAPVHPQTKIFSFYIILYYIFSLFSPWVSPFSLSTLSATYGLGRDGTMTRLEEPRRGQIRLEGAEEGQDNANWCRGGLLKQVEVQERPNRGQGELLLIRDDHCEIELRV